MAYNEQLAVRVRGDFRRRKVAFTEKPMMGGLCFLVHDKMCVGVEKDRLMVRLDPEFYDEALTREGCVPMDFTGRPMRGFVFVHAAGYSTDGALASWIDAALEFNPKAKSSKKPGKGSTTKPTKTKL
jgi:TfoX/Sxy family transcriptional regulator of competence genes